MFSKKFTNIFIFFLYFSLILGFFFNEDLIGGALNDYKGLFYVTENFRLNFLSTLLNYDNFGHRQSPIFYVLSSLIAEGEIFNRLFYIHLFLLIPFFFYKCLKLTFKGDDKNNLKIFAFIILIFPTFRSYSLWPDPHLLGFLFFIISIYFFLKFQNNYQKFNYPILNTIFLSLSAYVSPNFGVFILYFLYKYFTKFHFSKKFLYILLINFFLSIPFFYYLFYLEVNFLFDNSGWGIGKNFYSLENISNKIIIISSIFLFFIIPLINFRKIEIFNDLKSKKIFYFIPFIIFFTSCYYFDFTETYNLTNSGGGIFYNLSNYFFGNNYFLFFVSFISFILLSNLFYKNFENILLFICLLLSNPQLTIWQANHSPTIFVLILLLFNINFLKSSFNIKNIIIIYLYFILYILVNLVKILLI